MRSERGQATTEWIGLLLLVALALAALGHLASRADGRELGTTLAHSITHPSHPKAARIHPGPTLNRQPQEVSGVAGPRLSALPPSALAAGRDALRRAGRGAGLLWRRAWFACLVYERTRYAFRHPESEIPGYTLPYGVALRMINSCLSPVDLLSEIPGLDPDP
jgi:hypothetical protein